MSHVKLRPYQDQALAAEDEYRREHPDENRLLISMATGLGKGHPLETEVPTPDGWRRWGDLEPGDAVFGRDGSSTEVLEVYDRGMLETYRVTLSDGSSVLVDGDHLWTVRDSSASYRPWVDVETRELAATPLKRARGWRFHVPIAAPLERKPRDLPLDPYVVGALISNGSMVSSGTQLTTPDLEVAARVAGATFCNKIKDETPGVCDRYSLPGLVPVTRDLGLRVRSAEKRVPAAYLEGSLEQRMDLLHGLMDGDGAGRDTSRRSVAYYTSSEGLARGVSELVTSLGGTGIVKRYDRDSRGVEYAVRILLPSSVPAFSSSRKSGAGSSTSRDLQPRRAVVSVVLEGSSPIRCIRVAARDSLYLITRQHIVTHNTITFAERARRFLDSPDGWGRRVLVLVHTDELVRQAVKKVSLMTETDDAAFMVGVVKADRNQVEADIVVASVQTLIQPGRKEQITDVGYIIVDEAHHATAASYRTILEWYGGMPFRGHLQNEPRIPVLGVTATPERSDGAGLGQVWHNLVFSRETTWAMRKGYLVDLVPYTIRIPELNVSASDSVLDAALVDSLAPETIVSAWQEKVLRPWSEREPIGDCPTPSTVLFAPGVASAREFAASFSEAGVKAEVVHGGTPQAERRAILDRYEAGVTTVLCNAMVLTEGWDSPRTSCVIVARPTKSVPLFVQMVGRGLRPWLAAEAPPREDQRCILLSIAGAANELASAADLSDKLAELADGASLLAMEDQWDLGAGIEDKPAQYVGPIRVDQWDEVVARSSKAWKYTAGGVPFLPTAKRGQGYVFVVEKAGEWIVWAREQIQGPGMQPAFVQKRAVAPDLELAMALAEDEAQERGGDIGRLIADKGRAWRKAYPSPEMRQVAERLGINVGPILNSRSAGKAGRLSDAIDKVTASRVLDPVAVRIKERASK